MSPTATDERDWALFVDWCISVDAAPELASRELVSQFVADAPAALATTQRRIRAIRRHLDAAGAEHDLPPRRWPTVVRTGPEWADLGAALAQIPTLRFPVGLRGRRDAFLVVLLVGLRMTRREALGLGPEDIELFPRLRIRNLDVPRAEQATMCPRCAVTRWLRVVEPAARGLRIDVRDVVNPVGADLDVHDCAQALDGGWRAVGALLPAIDQYGWVASGTQMSLVAVSAIAAARQRLTGETPRGAVERRAPSARVDQATSAELAAAYDDVDQRLAELLARAAAAVDDADGLLDRMEELGLD